MWLIATWRASVWPGHDLRSIAVALRPGVHEAKNVFLTSWTDKDQCRYIFNFINTAMDDDLAPLLLGQRWRTTSRFDVASCLLNLSIKTKEAREYVNLTWSRGRRASRATSIASCLGCCQDVRIILNHSRFSVTIELWQKRKEFEPSWE